MKTILYATLAVFLPAVTLVGTPIVSITPQTVTTSPGDLLDVYVNISGVSDLYAFQFDIGFVSAVLSASSLAEGGFLPSAGSTFFVPGTIESGNILDTADTLVGAALGSSGAGTLAVIQFLTASSGTSAITISNLQLLDSNLNSIIASTVNGGVTIQTMPECKQSFVVGIAILLLLSCSKTRRDCEPSSVPLAPAAIKHCLTT